MQSRRITLANSNNHLFTRLYVTAVFLTALFLPTTLQAAEWQRVKAVIDGDTLLLGNDRFVRYIGINAPEIAHHDKPGEPFGVEAARYHTTLIGTQRVRLEFDRQKTDHYGRLLAYVYTEDGVMLNRAMLAAGMAYYLYKPPNLRYADTFLATQRKAMNVSKGIWTQLGRTGGPVLGNKRSRRFHRPDCRNVRKMSRKNRIHISSHWQAFRKGYAPGKNCLGGMPLD